MEYVPLEAAANTPPVLFWVILVCFLRNIEENFKNLFFFLLFSYF